MWRWFYNEDAGDAGDYFIIEVTSDGSTWVELENLGGNVVDTNHWTNVSFQLEQYVTPSATMQIRVRAADGTADAGDLVEAAFDDVVITGINGCLEFGAIFTDGFETGDTTQWSNTLP